MIPLCISLPKIKIDDFYDRGDICGRVRVTTYWDLDTGDMVRCDCASADGKEYLTVAFEYDGKCSEDFYRGVRGAIEVLDHAVSVQMKLS